MRGSRFIFQAYIISRWDPVPPWHQVRIYMLKHISKPKYNPPPTPLKWTGWMVILSDFHSVLCAVGASWEVRWTIWCRIFYERYDQKDPYKMQRSQYKRIWMSLHICSCSKVYQSMFISKDAQKFIKAWIYLWILHNFLPKQSKSKIYIWINYKVFLFYLEDEIYVDKSFDERDGFIPGHIFQCSS